MRRRPRFLVPPCARRPPASADMLCVHRYTYKLLLCTLGCAVPITAARYSRSAVLTHATAAAATVAISRRAAALPPPDLLAKAPLAPQQLREQAAVLYTPPPVKGTSTPDQIGLAEHLSRSGAKFYGAYWCGFCLKQRAMFGAGGSRRLPYVECAEGGYQADAALCEARRVTGYPSWEIGGKLYSGMKSLPELQRLSGFNPAVQFPAPEPPLPPPPPPPGGFKPPEVETVSTSYTVALAKHLRSSGAVFYGAHWCRFCGLQRSLFGREAARQLPYVECAADGFGSEATRCRAAPEVRAYPSWSIGGKFYSGYLPLQELAKLSGFMPPAAPPAATPAEGLGIDFGSAPPVQRAADEGCELPSRGVDGGAAAGPGGGAAPGCK